MSNQVEIIYSSGRNSKETDEIIRISPRKSARGIMPLHAIKKKKEAKCKYRREQSQRRSAWEFERNEFDELAYSNKINQEKIWRLLNNRARKKIRKAK